MSIFIPFKNYRYQGGVATFMSNLQTFLDENEFEYLDDPHQAKVIFFPITFDQNILAEIKAKGGRVIQRLAGGYYPSQHGGDYAELNRPIADVYSNFADFVIFQSEYGRKQDFTIFGPKEEGEYKVIVNGVNKKIFYPASNSGRAVKKPIFISTGSFRKKVMLEPAIVALDSLSDRYEFEYWIIGEVTNPELQQYLNRPYVSYEDKLPLNQLADKLRAADAFIHTQVNDICPNSVLEAISTGLPVIGFDSGSMAELLAFNTELLAYVSGDLLQKIEDFSPKNLAEKLEVYLSNKDNFREIAMKNAYLYSFNDCGKQYVEIFQQQLNLVATNYEKP